MLSLAGCSIQEVVATAADAAAGKALSSTLSGISETFDQGLVDSEIIAQLDSMVGDQVGFLLSSELGAELGELMEQLGQSDPAQGTSKKVSELTASISERCSEHGIDFSN